MWTIGWIAAEYLERAVVRHLYRLRDVQAVVGQRLRLSLVFGAAVYAILWIPVVNFFFIPAPWLGGTLLYLGWRETSALPPSPRLL